MTDEELIAELRKPWFTNGCERYQLDAADRIEALKTALRLVQTDGLHIKHARRAERLEARLAAAVGVLEFYARSERDDAGLLAETVLAKIKGADHD